MDALETVATILIALPALLAAGWTMSGLLLVTFVKDLALAGAALFVAVTAA